MTATAMSSGNDDPRKLRSILARAVDLASEHRVPSTLAGLAVEEGELGFPDFVDFLESALRVEDGIFRMTRERIVVHLADCDEARGREILERLIHDFADEFPSSQVPKIAIQLYGVAAGTDEISVKQVLTEVFPPRMLH